MVVKIGIYIINLDSSDLITSRPGAEYIFMSTSMSTLVMDEYKYEYIGDG